MLLLPNAEIYALEPLGRRQLVTTGGQITWIGDEPRLVIAGAFEEATA